MATRRSGASEGGVPRCPGTRWLEDLWQDARYALRIFAKNPGTTAVAVLSLALAIGPNATLFSVVDRMFLRPVTVQGSSEIFFLYPKADRAGKSESPSYPDFLDYQARGRGVADFIANSGRGVMLNVNRRQPVGVRGFGLRQLLPGVGGARRRGANAGGKRCPLRRRAASGADLLAVAAEVRRGGRYRRQDHHDPIPAVLCRGGGSARLPAAEPA